MTRRCKSCLRILPLRDFNLGTERVSSTCLSCNPGRRTAPVLEPAEARVTALKGERRSLIAELVQVDAQIARLRAHRSSQIEDLLDEREQHRRSRIAALVTIDAEIADLLAIESRPRMVVDETPSVDTVFGDDATVDDRLSDEI